MVTVTSFGGGRNDMLAITVNHPLAGEFPAARHSDARACSTRSTFAVS